MLRRASTTRRVTDLELRFAALIVLLQHHIDDARDRVGSIDRGGTVLQHLDALYRVDRNGVQVYETANAVIGERVVGRTPAVDEHQGRIHREAAKRDPGRASRESQTERGR